MAPTWSPDTPRNDASAVTTGNALASEYPLEPAEFARDLGDRPAARTLLRDFERRFTDDPTRDRARRLAELLARAATQSRPRRVSWIRRPTAPRLHLR